jgi:hypothetical protein
MSLWNFRLAAPSDAEAFAKWVTENPQISVAEIDSARKDNNPTVLTFVSECDGVPVSFVPIYLVARVAHMAFSPDARASEKIKSLAVLKDGLAAFFVQFGIREIEALSLPEFGVAKWAEANGFEREPRDAYRLDLNKEMKETVEVA